MKIVALAGGVGGAKLVHGLAQVLPAQELTVIVNTGDDFEHLGLHISPDLDTVCYTLAGLADNETGWGRADEKWQAMTELEQLGGPGWFRLGDRDLGTHLERTRRLRGGQPLSSIVRGFCEAWGIKQTVLPMTDAPVSTIVQTGAADLQFQEYFVHQKCQPRVTGFRFEGIEAARPAPGVVEALLEADGVVICPSNPWVSIGPILAIADLKTAIASKIVLAISPIIGGKTVKGPADKMFREMGIEPTAHAVASLYAPLARLFVMDKIDSALAGSVRDLGMTVLLTNTLMRNSEDRRSLAEGVLDFMQANRS
jgi:LPPG:FO 2-phospho-L-lactate transferase